MEKQAVYQSLNDLPLVLSVRELAEVLGIGRSLAYRLIHEKRIRSIKIGSTIRVPKAAVIMFLED